MTLKSGLEVTEGHSKWHQSIDRSHTSSRTVKWVNVLSSTSQLHVQLLANEEISKPAEFAKNTNYTPIETTWLIVSAITTEATINKLQSAYNIIKYNVWNTV